MLTIADVMHAAIDAGACTNGNLSTLDAAYFDFEHDVSLRIHLWDAKKARIWRRTTDISVVKEWVEIEVRLAEERRREVTAYRAAMELAKESLTDG